MQDLGSGIMKKKEPDWTEATAPPSFWSWGISSLDLEKTTSARTIWASESSTGRPSGSAKPTPDDWRIYDNDESEDMMLKGDDTHCRPSAIRSYHILSLDDLSRLEQNLGIAKLIDIALDSNRFVRTLNVNTQTLQVFLQNFLCLALR